MKEREKEEGREDREEGGRKEVELGGRERWNRCALGGSIRFSVTQSTVRPCYGVLRLKSKEVIPVHFIRSEEEEEEEEEEAKLKNCAFQLISLPLSQLVC